MKRILTKIAALCLCICLLLTGCVDLPGYWQELGEILGLATTAFADMEYVRPEQGAVPESVAAVEKAISDGVGVEELMEAVYAAYGTYYDFYTNYSLANIHYYRDLTDIYWEDEYEHCLTLSAEVDAAMDNMLYCLADCPLKEELEAGDFFGEDFFDAYQGESIWDETFTALMEKEAKLQSRYYELSEESMAVQYGSEAFYTTYGKQMMELYVELVQLRQEIAAYAGYTDYPSFAYEFYYARDYSPQHAMNLMEQIATELLPVYRSLGGNDVWYTGYLDSTQKQTMDYVRSAATAVGGVVEEAFQVMEAAGLYDISCSENKYAASFEVYLVNYECPYVFVNPSMTVYDQLTFVHEFGHFSNDYASYGNGGGIDVKEFFSQGMEYLSLTYADGGSTLEELKLADSLCIYVEQTAYAWFEQQVYGLQDDALTVEAVTALYGEAMKTYGLDMWGVDSRSYVGVHHFFDAPLYIISYVVSNDAALQLYQLEQQTAGSGKTLYMENLDTLEWNFLAFVESAGLESPFAPERMKAVRATFEEVFLP